MVVSCAFRVDIVHVYVDWNRFPCAYCRCTKPFNMLTTKCNGMCPIDNRFSDISCFLHLIFILRFRQYIYHFVHVYHECHTHKMCVGYANEPIHKRNHQIDFLGCYRWAPGTHIIWSSANFETK